MNKTFELSIDERELMCRMLRYCMVNNADCNFSGGEWLHPEAEKDELAMQDLHDKLKVPTPVKKSGWMNVYSGECASAVHKTREHADKYAGATRVKCVEVFWEE